MPVGRSQYVILMWCLSKFFTNLSLATIGVQGGGYIHSACRPFAWGTHFIFLLFIMIFSERFWDSPTATPNVSVHNTRTVYSNH